MLKDKILPYLEAKESEWALTTWKSEKARLQALGDLIDLPPKELHQELKNRGYKPYSIKTLFIRLADLQNWAGLNCTFGLHLGTHKNRFKHAYTKEEVAVTYEEALVRIAKLDTPYQEAAIAMLKTGVRISEAFAVVDGKVVGKGGKTRKVYGKVELNVSKQTLRNKLKSIGLKPHTLRKLCATRLAEKGATAADLCKVFGWSDIRTAFQYLQARDDERIQKLFEE